MLATVTLTGQDVQGLAGRGDWGVSALMIVLIVAPIVAGFVSLVIWITRSFLAEIRSNRNDREAQAIRHEQFVTETSRQNREALERNTGALSELSALVGRVPCLDGECPARAGGD